MLAQRTNIIKRYAFLCLSIMLMAVIFWFSAQTATDSSEDSEGVLWFVMNSIPFLKSMSYQVKYEIIEAIHTFVRKTAHFSIYALLGVFVISYVKTYKIAVKRSLITTVLICFIYACSDEIHQLFVPGRSGEIRDVLLDSSGAFVGAYLVILCAALIQRIKRRKQG